MAEKLGHAYPAFTLKTYAHLMPSESEDMSFADFTASAEGTKRHKLKSTKVGKDEDQLIETG